MKTEIVCQMSKLFQICCVMMEIKLFVDMCIFHIVIPCRFILMFRWIGYMKIDENSRRCAHNFEERKHHTWQTWIIFEKTKIVPWWRLRRKIVFYMFANTFLPSEKIFFLWGHTTRLSFQKLFLTHLFLSHVTTHIILYQHLRFDVSN